MADNGQELFKHSYGDILHCCIAVDGISFAYAVRHEKGKYFCHVFQALTYEEVRFCFVMQLVKLMLLSRLQRL